MIVLIVVISVISDMAKSKNNNNVDESKEPNEDLSQHIGPLKDRVANLETIILEKERNKEFTDGAEGKD